MLDLLEDDLNLTVAAAAQSRLFVRAAAVGWKRRALLVLGPPGSGKTTLVAALLKAGATYYSDQYAPLDVHGCLHPYPTALIARHEDDSRRRTAPTATGAEIGTQAIPIGAVIRTRYKPTSRWRALSLSPGTAGLVMLSYTVGADRRPEFTLAVLQRALSGALLLSGVRGEAAAAAERLLNLIRS